MQSCDICCGGEWPCVYGETSPSVGEESEDYLLVETCRRSRKELIRLGAREDAEHCGQAEWQVQDPEACRKELGVSRE